MKSFENEVRERWGGTAAFKEYSKKAKGFDKNKLGSLSDGMDSILSEFSECMRSCAKPDGNAAQSLVRKLQNYITESFYTCTDEILAGLGLMYTADERFKSNIDRHGDGTAEFIASAIKAYCP